MKLLTLAKTGTLATLFLAAFANAAPQDGSWKVTTSCGPNVMNKRGPFSVDTEIKINNGLMKYQWSSPYKEFLDITNWEGKISGKSLTLTAQGNRSNGESWTYKFDGTVINPNKMTGTGALYNSEKKVARDCTLDFTMIQGASKGPTKADIQVERALDKAWLEAEKQKLEAQQAAIDSKSQEVEKKERQLREKEALLKKEKAAKDAANTKTAPSPAAASATPEKPKPAPVSSGF
jgi:hypothetical protein